MLNKEAVNALQQYPTPFYYYNLDTLRATLSEVKKHALDKGYRVHFALKANFNARILNEIRNAGIGADCVSGGEIARAVETGFNPSEIVFAGVGKSDDEIELALLHDIFCFNCESVQELKVINELAVKHNKKPNVALRLNPDVDAKTHKYITTGLNENKFGINEEDLDTVLDLLPSLSNVELIGIHFHIGSQVESLEPYRQLCKRANQLNAYIESKGFTLTVINVGGGLGINYQEPDQKAIPDFEAFFGVYDELIELKPHQQLHFELGRAIVGQCGSLITRVLYTKPGRTKNFAVIDAGMTELIRPALYQAEHALNVFKTTTGTQAYDVVGPICESSDVFRTDIMLPELERGDMLAIRSSGAYGEVMQSEYNLRTRRKPVYSDDLK